jgi:photosystem II stability/assembly factor-like uncharacterized protein
LLKYLLTRILYILCIAGMLSACTAQDWRAMASAATQTAQGDAATIAPVDSPALTLTSDPVLTETPSEIPAQAPDGAAVVTPEPTQSIPAENTPPAGEPLTLTNLQMVTAEYGWALDAHGRLLHTHDGALHWNDITPPDEGDYVWSGFFALDAKRAWVTAQQGLCQGVDCPEFVPQATIWRTEDGGQNWQASEPLCLAGDCGYDFQVLAAFYSPVQMQFINEKNGWLLATVDHMMFQDRYRIYHTRDGGNTWQMITDTARGPMAFSATGLSFLDEQSGWFALSQVGGAEQPAPNWYIYHTTNGGKSWFKYKLPVPLSTPDIFSTNTYWCGATDLQATPPDVLDLTIACKVYTETDELSYEFQLHSITSGDTWITWQKTASQDFMNATWGWRIVSDDQETYTLERTLDGGVIWQSVGEVPAGKLDFTNELSAWVLNEQGACYHTADGGLAWEKIEPLLTTKVSIQSFLPTEPQNVTLSAANGETFQAVYYPPSTSPAPVVILMHQVNKNMHQWDAVAAWLWKGEISQYTDAENSWLNSTWFPENTLAERPAVLVFNYRDCGMEACYRPSNQQVLKDAQTALQYVLTLPATDVNEITVIGTSVGADAALNSCFLLQDDTDYACKNVLAFSPGSYLDYKSESVIKVLTLHGSRVYCFAARADIESATICLNPDHSDQYVSFVGKGLQHGIEIFSPEYETNVLDAVLQAIEK